MNDNDYDKKSHKKIAMEFLTSANNDLEVPVDEDLIERIYDLFSEEKSETQSYQNSLEKIVKD
ncbi:hypothetical protein N8370_07915 [Amylibacter sp.]|nr:hypothetical protein [Amylibacter sp.]